MNVLILNVLVNQYYCNSIKTSKSNEKAVTAINSIVRF